MAPSSKPVICFGLAEWDSPLPTNQHHLVRRLARTRPVLFVDTVGTRRPRLTPADLRRVLERLFKARAPLKQVEANLWRLSAMGPAPGLGPALKQAMRNRFVRSLGRACRDLGWREAAAWVFNARAAFVLEGKSLSLLDSEWPGGTIAPVIYHSVDDLTIVPGAARTEIGEAEAFLAQQADLILASAPPILERLEALAPGRTRHAPNVADFDHFHRVASESLQPPAPIAALPRPRIVFAGNLTGSKMDFALARQLAGARPAWQWIFIGPVWEGLDPSEGFDRLRALPNVHFPGLAPYADLPAWLAGADALFIPYRVDGAAASVFPLKFFEFLATGRPVAATPLPALAPHGDVAPLAADPTAFLAAIEAGLSEPPDAPARAARIERARLHSWDRRMEEIEAWLREAEARRGAP